VPWFEYEGQCPNGTAISGRIEAENHDSAHEMLAKTMRLTVTDVRQVTSPPPPSPISENDLIFLNEQLASLASAGMVLDEGLEQLARDVHSKRLKRFIEAIVADLREGRPLDEAVARHESRLPVLYSRVIRAGVKGGNLAATLLGLNQHMRLMGQTRHVLWETLSYPIFLLIGAFAILTFFFLDLVPQFKEIYIDFGTDLPGPTMLMVGISDAFPQVLIGSAIVVAAAIVGWQLLRTTPTGRIFRESLFCHIPMIGRIYRASLVSRFVRSVATSVQVGIDLPEALKLAGGVTGSPGLIAEAERVADDVEQGEPIFQAAQLCTLIPPIFGYTVQVAAGRDALPSSLNQLAESYEARALHYHSLLRILLFPMIIVVVGGLIAFGVIGLWLPMVTLVNAVSGGG
jgi:type II secretory pathway component PulF